MTAQFVGSTLYGTWPEPYQVEENRDTGVLVLRTPFYEVQHDLRKGGAIQSIRDFHTSGENLLLAPIGCEVNVVGSAAFSDLADASARVDVKRVEDGAKVDVQGVLRSAEGESCGVEYHFVYEYRWGAIRLHQQFRFPKRGLRVNRLSLLRLLLRPNLGSFGVRPGAPAETSSDPAAFGVCQWGRFVPGASFDCAYESRFVPRYVVCADQGREGLEWFPSSNLSQWDYQICGKPGHGRFQLAPQANPPGIRCDIAALHLPRGDKELAGDYTFDSWIGLPIISGRGHRPFLHTSFNRKHWPTKDLIRSWAERGIRTAHFHHDGDSFRDGLFWRDGSYPPFGPEDMKEYDRVIRACQEHGIRVATYFSNKELHPTTEAHKAHGQEWARLPGDRGEQIHNHYSGDEYGAQMCLRSGWLDQLKQNIDTVLTNHPLNGVYYDWNVALYCHNTAHVAGANAAPASESAGMGVHAFSPAGHWDVDELVDLMEWTRRRVGKDGLVIIHNTMVPCGVTENFADHVVAMEWGYGRLSVAAPPLEALPLEWNYLGARPRGVIGYGCLEPGAPESVHRQMTLRCLLTGVAPWPAQDLDLEMFAPLRDSDLSNYRFYDWRRSPVKCERNTVASAVYANDANALVLVGNLTSQPQSARCALALSEIGFGEGRSLAVRSGSALEPITSASFTVDLPPEGIVVLRIEEG